MKDLNTIKYNRLKLKFKNTIDNCEVNHYELNSNFFYKTNNNSYHIFSVYYIGEKFIFFYDTLVKCGLDFGLGKEDIVKIMNDDYNVHKFIFYNKNENGYEQVTQAD